MCCKGEMQMKKSGMGWDGLIDEVVGDKIFILIDAEFKTASKYGSGNELPLQIVQFFRRLYIQPPLQIDF
jgi:hypothetical protein